MIVHLGIHVLSQSFFDHLHLRLDGWPNFDNNEHLPNLVGLTSKPKGLILRAGLYVIKIK